MLKARPLALLQTSAAVRPRLSFARHCLHAACMIGLLLATTAPMRAGEDGAKPDLWIVTVGGWATLEPSFEGSRSLKGGGRPILNWRNADSKDWIVLPNDGFDFELIETDNFRAGPVASWSWIRGDSLLRRGYRRLHSIDLSVEAGAFAEYWLVPWLRTRLEIRDAVWGGKGWVGDLATDVVWHPVPTITMTGGPRISVADAQFMRIYYGVAPDQAVATGLPSYAASAGVRSVGLGTMLKKDWTPAWSTMAFVEYQRLAGSAGNSPVIDAHGSADQFTMGIGLSYSFSFAR